jgi:hypothetical protein
MSKMFSGIGKAIKGVVKGVKKVYKKVVESKIGKALLIAATIYLGGAALGAWSSPFSSINGALVKGGAAGAKASAATVNTASGLTTTALPSTAAGATTGGTLLPGAGVKSIAAGGLQTTAPTAGQSLISSTIPTQLGGTSAGMATPTALKAGAGVKSVVAGGLETQAAPAADGILNRLLAGAGEKLSKTAGFVNDHPYATAMALNAVGSAFTADAVDVAQMQQKQEEKDRLRREANLDVGGININATPSRRPLTYTDGTPVYGAGGILNRNVSRRT